MSDGGALLASGFFLGFTVGMMAHTVIDRMDSDSPTNIVRRAVEVCEQNLTRNQSCEITAIVKGKE